MLAVVCLGSAWILLGATIGVIAWPYFVGIAEVWVLEGLLVIGSCGFLGVSIVCFLDFGCLGCRVL
jgi:hypothetical protein